MTESFDDARDDEEAVRLQNEINKVRGEFQRGKNIRQLPDCIAFERRGELVWREIGKAGADLPMTPHGWKAAQATKAYLSNINKIIRYAKFLESRHKGNDKQIENAKLLQAEVNRLWTQLESKGRGRAAIIASKLGISARHVRRIVQKTDISEID
jgi:hypothetical protein